MWSLVVQPVVIDGPGHYLTRAGEVVTIEKASAHHDFACVGVYPNQVQDSWHKSGRLYFGTESKNDIVRRV
jgi:hypothetical protein